MVVTLVVLINVIHGPLTPKIYATKAKSMQIIMILDDEPHQ